MSEKNISKMEAFARWLAANKVARAVLRFVWWSIVYRCPNCGHELRQKMPEDYSPEEARQIVQQHAWWVLQYAYECTNEACPESKGLGYMIC